MKPPNVTPPPQPQLPSSTEKSVPNASIPQLQPSIQTTQHMHVVPQIQTTTPVTASPNTITIQHQTQQPRVSSPPTSKDVSNIAQTNVPSQPIITTQAIVVLKSAPIGQHHEQQAPLALTTQPQNKLSLQTTSALQIQQQQAAVSVVAPSNTVSIQQHPTTQSTKETNSVGRTNLTPQALITTQANIVTKTSVIGSQQEQQAPLALITQPHNKPSAQANSSPTPQIQQQQLQVPATATAANVKQEPNKYVCCLLDQGVRCDRVAGNASFSARIQKIVASKKMNFILDPIVRHTYICDHHKAVITVAKKSVPTARESKAAARNLAAAAAAAAANNVSTNQLPTQHINNYNDVTMSPATIQHPVNLDLIASQGRLANNHTGMLIGMPIRPGTQPVVYSHYSSGPHPSQMGRLDPSIMTTSSFDGAGGDSLPSGSGGVEVDLQQLQVNTLRRYKRHFRVQTRPGLNKMQLAESLKHHFRTLPIIEKEAITYFVYIVKSSRNKLDHNPKAD